MASEMINYVINLFAHYIHSLIVQFFLPYVSIPFTFLNVSSLSNSPRPGVSFRNTLYFPDHTVAVGASSHSLNCVGDVAQSFDAFGCGHCLVSVGK